MRKADGSLACNARPRDNATVFGNHFKKLYERKPTFDASMPELLQQRRVATGLDHPPSTDGKGRKDDSALSTHGCTDAVATLAAASSLEPLSVRTVRRSGTQRARLGFELAELMRLRARRHRP